MPFKPIHGLVKHPLNKCWHEIKQRCLNPNNHAYHYYGGRGISICEEWKENFLNFYNWAINNGWKIKLEIDRINVNGNYEPSNCRFVTRTENTRNRRNVRQIKIFGESLTLTEIVEKFKIPYAQIYARIITRGWSPEKAVTTEKSSRGYTVSRAQNWKNAEKSLAKALRKKGIPAKRLTRAMNFSLSIPDVEIEGCNKLKFDSKYSAMKPFRHHGLLKTIQNKYCKQKDETPILYTKNFREHGGYITITEDYFASLLQARMILDGDLTDEIMQKVFQEDSDEQNNELL